ncbi:hypothetical protein FI667_g3450, partial [Globisporangium splendens]
MLARDAVKTSNLFATLSKSTTSSRPAAVSVKPHGGSVSGSSTASNDTTPTSNGDKKKKKKKKKSASASANVVNNATTSENNGALENPDGEEIAKKKTLFTVRNTENGDQDTTTDPSQLPLAKRLEVAAAHADIHAALVGLLGWSRLYVNTDTILEFFQSNALEMLLENILQANPATDAIYDNLNALLANCLSIERNGKASSSNREIANAVVSTVRVIVDKLKGSSRSNQDIVAVKKAAQYLSKLVLHYRVSLNGVKVGSTLSEEILRIDTKLANAASKDGAVQGQTIRDTFQRRDIRCDALALYEVRLAKINQLVKDNISSSTQHLQATNAQEKSQDTSSSGFSAFAADDGNELDPQALASIKQQLQSLNERKAAEIAPLDARRHGIQKNLQVLKKKREELEAQLRAVSSEIQDTLDAHLDVDEQITAVEERFEAEMSHFDDEHQHIIQQFQQKERRDQIDAAFSQLQETITKISLEHSEVQSLKEKRVVCLRQHLEGILRYFASELPCVKFMMGRAEQAEVQLQKYVNEAEGYKVLGVSAVAKELAEKAASLQGHLDEDKKCLEALQTKDLQLLDTIKRLFHDPEHADALVALDPALKREVQRHVDYITKIYEPVTRASSNGSSSPAKSSTDAPIGSQKKK